MLLVSFMGVECLKAVVQEYSFREPLWSQTGSQEQENPGSSTMSAEGNVYDAFLFSRG